MPTPQDQERADAAVIDASKVVNWRDIPDGMDVQSYVALARDVYRRWHNAEPPTNLQILAAVHRAIEFGWLKELSNGHVTEGTVGDVPPPVGS
jgi:hypothetical protein